MITVLLHMTVKAEREDAFREMVPRLTQTTHAEDPGCIAYAFYCRADNRNEAVLYEQWKDADALNAHVARLVRVLGPPDDQEPHPPTHHRRRLPKAFLDLFEKTDAVRYEPVA
jgi:quinol monooxygenase YgiN